MLLEEEVPESEISFYIGFQALEKVMRAHLDNEDAGLRLLNTRLGKHFPKDASLRTGMASRVHKRLTYLYDRFLEIVSKGYKVEIQGLGDFKAGLDAMQERFGVNQQEELVL